MQYNTSNSFSDMNVDPIRATAIMEALNADAIDLQSSGRAERLQDIIGYLQNKQDAEYVIRRLTTDKTKDPIDHVWSFIVLRKEYESLEDEIRQLKGGSVFDHDEDEMLENKRKELKRKHRMLREELKFYDK